MLDRRYLSEYLPVGHRGGVARGCRVSAQTRACGEWEKTNYRVVYGMSGRRNDDMRTLEMFERSCPSQAVVDGYCRPVQGIRPVNAKLNTRSSGIE